MRLHLLIAFFAFALVAYAACGSGQSGADFEPIDGEGSGGPSGLNPDDSDAVVDTASASGSFDGTSQGAIDAGDGGGPGTDDGGAALDGDGESTDTSTEDIATAPVPPHESYICDGLDEDQDGLTDEDCSFLLVGGLFGAGHAIGVDPESETIENTLSAPAFTGISEGGGYRLTPVHPGGSP